MARFKEDAYSIYHSSLFLDNRECTGSGPTLQVPSSGLASAVLVILHWCWSWTVTERYDWLISNPSRFEIHDTPYMIHLLFQVSRLY